MTQKGMGKSGEGGSRIKRDRQQMFSLSWRGLPDADDLTQGV